MTCSQLNNELSAKTHKDLCKFSNKKKSNLFHTLNLLIN